MRAVVLCLMLACFHVSLAQESALPKGDGASLLQGVRLNAEALQQYDVLIEKSVLIDTPTKIEETVSVLRILVDKSTKVCFLANRSKQTVTQISDKGSKTDVGEKLSINRVKDSRYSLSSFPGVAREGMASVGTFDEAMRAASIPDFAPIGVWKFELPTKQYGAEEFWTSLAVQAERFGKTNSKGDAITSLTMNSPINDNEDMRFVTHIDFDNNSLMPVSRSVDVVINKNVQPYAREQIIWQSRGGVFVPLSINLSDLRATKSQAGARTVCEVSTITKLKWISINSPIDKTFTTAADSIDTLLRATDTKLFEDN